MYSQLAVAGEQTARHQSDRGTAGGEGSPDPEGLVALGSLGKEAEHARQRRREDQGGAGSLECSHQDEQQRSSRRARRRARRR